MVERRRQVPRQPYQSVSKAMQTRYRSSTPRSGQRAGAQWPWSKAFTALTLFLVLVFATGGASRPDVDSLLVLRPAAALFLMLGLYWLPAGTARENRFLLIWAALIVLLALAHLVPLPPQVWQSLPGRELIVQIDQATGLEGTWRPLSMTPGAGRNAFWSLFPPLACLVLAVQLTRREIQKTLGLVIVLGLISAVLGMLQLLGDPRGPLYLYDFTNNGAAVGLYANRNHQALLLASLLPMLAVWARAGNPTQSRRGARSGLSARQLRALLAIGAGAFLIPLILITGSRAGLILGSAGLLIAFGLALAALRRGSEEQVSSNSTQPRPQKRTRQIIGLLLTAGAILMVGLTIALQRDLAIERLLERDIAEDARAKTLPTVMHMTRYYLPLGSGFGSFEKVYQIHEDNALLGPTYMNHAHNDWLELVQTGGLPALGLIIALAGWWTLHLRSLASSQKQPGPARRLAIVGSSVLVLAGLASVGDYPLRAPSLSCLFTLALVWIAQLNRTDESGHASPR